MRATVFLLLLGVALPARATILEQLDVDALVQRSTVIVVGVVGEQRTVTPNGRVLTESTIRVERILFGSAPESARVYNLGGQVGNVITDVPGTIRLQPGSRVLLMLRRARDGRLYVAGMCQGAFLLDGNQLLQRIDVPLVSGGRILPPPGVRELSLDDVDAAIARRVHR